MLPDSYRELFDALVAKTSRGEVNWSRSPQTDTFVVSFSDFGLSIDTGSDPFSNRSYVAIRLINDQGRIADSFWIEDGDQEWEAAFQLYLGAKRKAHRIDVTVKKVLGELRKSGAVGEPPAEPPSQDQFDDLPF
jgi:hypothetical protein